MEDTLVIWCEENIEEALIAKLQYKNKYANSVTVEYGKGEFPTLDSIRQLFNETKDLLHIGLNNLLAKFNLDKIKEKSSDEYDDGDKMKLKLVECVLKKPEVIFFRHASDLSEFVNFLKPLYELLSKTFFVFFDESITASSSGKLVFVESLETADEDLEKEISNEDLFC